MMADGDFSGAKIVLKCEDRLLTYLRDDKPGIPFPGIWDLPGGGREGQRWRMMPVERFLTRKDAVPDLQARLADYIAECGPSGP